MSRMFPETETDNPYTGCVYNCESCWARALALKFQARNLPKYKDGFHPNFHPNALSKPPKKAKNLFVCAMGDLFCPGARTEWIEAIMGWCHRSNRDQNFMFLTKNPRRYLDILIEHPEWINDSRFLFGATIETTGESAFSPRAPPPALRAEVMMTLAARMPKTRRFLSIEPVQGFNLDIMRLWIENIKPLIVYIGYDNYRTWPNEPRLEQVMELMELKGPKWIPKTLR